MPNIAVLPNDLQYEFTYKITHSPKILARKFTQFNQCLDEIRSLGQSVIRLQLINDPNDPNAPNDPAVQKRYRTNPLDVQ